ncbi:MAG TPA: hypothetical protein VGJ20_08815 [Xanthobacteraceae bacterium]|jgi:hypothetical protein
MPPFIVPDDSEHGPTVAQVVDKIECEIAEARNEADGDAQLVKSLNALDLAEFGQWAASTTMSLTVNDTGGLSPNGGLAFSYLNPLKTASQSFAFGGDALFYQQRQRIFTQTYTVNISKLPANETCASVEQKWNKLNLSGDLGLGAQIHLGLYAFVSSHGSSYIPASVKTGSPDSFGATASFDVFKGVTSLGPTWTLTHFKGVAGGLGYQRDDLNKIAITFAPAKYVAPPTHKGHATAQALIEYATMRAAANSNAIVAARQANAQLVTTQAIQQLGQILSTH